MKHFIYSYFYFLGILIFSCQPNKEMNTDILINHTGYQTNGIKKMVLQTNSNEILEKFELVNSENQIVYSSAFLDGGKIDNWHTGNAFEGVFSEFSKEGEYFIQTTLDGQEVKSNTFSIHNNSLSQQSLDLIIQGFESQHIAGDYDKKDAEMTFFGEREDIVDARGGWYDASGDRGKYLSHLCYSNYFNPQQIPMIAWNLFESLNQIKLNNQNIENSVIERMRKEAAYGSDYLMRVQDNEGYFYINIFANWSWEAEKREICAYEGSDGIKTDEYQAGFREGGGMAIAALARASEEAENGALKNEEYLQAAIKGFNHLVENNHKYIDDGIENIIDDYCALIAATELFSATNETSYLEYARTRMTILTSRLSSDENYKGWWSANEDRSRPFFHGVEPGLPVISLVRYLSFETDDAFRNTAINAIQKSVDFELNITNDVHNPFGYPRQYVKAVNEANKKATFFIPHENETGYWWQGENSRLASLTSAFYMAQDYLTETQKEKTIQYSANCLNWILGLNPYNVGMVDGLGYNNPDYREGDNSLNFKGGVCNGITAGFSDESDIAFMPLPQDDDPSHKWRWSEQWMPHASWFMLAVTTIK